MRYFLDLSYDGTAYHGWQTQPNARTVQEELENALSRLLGVGTPCLGSGRTDTGVHAKQQIVHFDSVKTIDPEHFQYRLNSFLPMTCAVNSIVPVKEKANARFDAVSRTYEYCLHANKNPFLNQRSLFIPFSLDVDKIIEGCTIISGWTNFQSFSKVHTDVKHYNCNIQNIQWETTNDGYLFTVSANRFLRGMIRAMVGTLLELGQGRLTPEELRSVLQAKDRSKAGKAVSPDGLYLARVEYPKDIYLNN